MILFLEFQGVLWPSYQPHAWAEQSYIGGIAPLEKILAPYLSQLDIVLSDPRVHDTPLDNMRSILPEQLSTRVVDSMYMSELISPAWSDYHSALATRYACIRAWMERRRPGYGGGWLALEEGKELDSWPKDAREHLVSGYLGDPAVQTRVASQLQEQLAKQG